MCFSVGLDLKLQRGSVIEMGICGNHCFVHYLSVKHTLTWGVAGKTGREWKHRSEILLYMLSHFTILKRLKVAHNPHNILKMYKGVDRISSSPDDSGFAFCVLIAFVVHICLNPAKTSSGIEQWLFICFVLWYDMFTPFTLDLFFTCIFTAPFRVEELTCLCSPIFADLNNIPSDLPSDIVKMDLSRNNIKHLRPKHFLLSKDLKLLNLSSNSLQSIDTGNTASPIH